MFVKEFPFSPYHLRALTVDQEIPTAREPLTKPAVSSYRPFLALIDTWFLRSGGWGGRVSLWLSWVFVASGLPQGFGKNFVAGLRAGAFIGSTEVHVPVWQTLNRKPYKRYCLQDLQVQS